MSTITSHQTLAQNQRDLRRTLALRQKSGISAVFFALLILGAFLSYGESGLGPLKLVAYGLSAVVLVGLLFIWPREDKTRAIIAIFFSLIFGFVSALTILRAEIFYSYGTTSMAMLIQELTYPLISLFLVLVGFRLIFSNRTLITRVIVILAMANWIVAALGILGYLDHIPLFGSVNTGRWIFFTRIPSSNGLMLNVNYYATAQVSLFFFYGIVQSLTKSSLSRKDYIILLFIFLSSLLGSSRGITVASIGALVIIYFIVVFMQKSSRGRILFFVLLSSIGIWLTVVDFRMSDYLPFYDTVYREIRLDRGLNSRDVLWAAGIELWWQRPLLGSGTASGSLLANIDSITTERSLHSGYVHMLATRGLFGFFASFGFVLFCIFWGLGFNRRIWFKYRWAVASISFYLISTAARTYSIGGLGLLPLLLGIAMSLCFYARSPIIRNHHVASQRGQQAKLPNIE
jgi:O-antigen ligase